MLAVGYVAAVLVGIEAPGSHWHPLLLAAVVPPLAIYSGALLTGFVALLVWTPFLDHRKLVWERDQEREARNTENREHWVERTKLDLKLKRRGLEGFPQRLDQMRDAEAVSPGRARERAMESFRLGEELGEWANSVAVSFSEGGYEWLVRELSNTLQGKTTADELETAYRRLLEIVDAVIEGQIQPE